ncbi:MAG TPA: hypothetical protein VJ783_15055 [Pirellulales bacterium]|nr:hypothetical protein [Pirellulales bacterium]
MKNRIMYIERKAGGLTGEARIGRALRPVKIIGFPAAARTVPIAYTANERRLKSMKTCAKNTGARFVVCPK